MSLQEEIIALKKEKNAVLLAHNYQIGEIQDIADYVGDSLGLAQQAAKTDADIIIFCGVHFMAETASIISPEKKVLIPDPEAGCSLADSINAGQLREWRSEHPGAVVVSYVNTTAEVKALTDYCCTSSNAVKVVESIPEDKKILFLPDRFLGQYVKKMTGRDIEIWEGACHVHEKIGDMQLDKAMEKFPGHEILIHPECGCSTSCLLKSTEAPEDVDIYVHSTGGMLRHAKESKADKFLVATETGILHRMKKENPGKSFTPVSEEAVCEYMKMITLEKVLASLQYERYEVKVPDDLAEKARLPIERMLSIT